MPSEQPRLSEDPLLSLFILMLEDIQYRQSDTTHDVDVDITIHLILRHLLRREPTKRELDRILNLDFLS